jgi:hypothetical protein
MGQGALIVVKSESNVFSPVRLRRYLEGSPEPEDTIVGFLRWQSLESQLDSIVLFWDEVVGPARHQLRPRDRA